MKNLIAPAMLIVAAAFVATNAQATYVGNYGSAANLVNVAPGGGPDGTAPLIILGEYSPVGPLGSSAVTLPSGTVQDVDFYGGNYNFTLYVLSPGTAGPNANEQTFTVVASQSFSGSATVGIQTLAISPGFSVSAGDLLAFAGIGPWYPQQPNDALNSDATYEDSSNPNSFSATPPGGPGTQFSVGLNPDPTANYEYGPDVFGNQGRTYAIGVDVSTVPEPTTMIAGALLLLPFGASTLRMLRKRQVA